MRCGGESCLSILYSIRIRSYEVWPDLIGQRLWDSLAPRRSHIKKSGGKGERSPGSSFFPTRFLMRSCDDELYFLYRRDGSGGHIPTNSIDVVCACIFVIQTYIHILYHNGQTQVTPTESAGTRPLPSND